VKPDEANAYRSLNLSVSNVEDAEENLRIQRYRVVIMSSYTAMSHAARAVLLRDGVKERSHECIPLYLKATYPQLGKAANILDSYRRFRHTAMYGLDLVLDAPEASTALDSAKSVLAQITKMFQPEG